MSENDNTVEGNVDNFVPASEGYFSAEKIIERLAKSRDEAGRLSNRFFVLALLFMGLGLIKLAGLDLSLTLIGIETDDLQYGLFFFVLAAQVCAVLSTSRTMDSRSFDYEIEKFVKLQFPGQSRPAVRTIPNAHEWLSPSSEVLETISGYGFPKFIYNVAMLVTVIFAIAVVFGPTALGVYYLFNHEALITEGDKDLQYWVVFAVTILSILWSCAYVAIHAITEMELKEGGDGD